MEKEEVTVFYEKADYYMLLPVTGAFGGVNPTGDILVEFYVDKKTPPERMILEVPGGREISREGERFVREIQIGILLRADVAHSIGRWLIEKAAQAGYKEVT